jgi:site-specific DNA-methyltransferase (cytosine-N4-specific)
VRRPILLLPGRADDTVDDATELFRSSHLHRWAVEVRSGPPSTKCGRTSCYGFPVTAPMFSTSDQAGLTAKICIGDAFDLIDSLAADSVDLVLTSPPYWGMRSYGQVHAEDVLERWEAEGCMSSRVPPYSWYRAAGGVLGLEPYPAWYVEHLIEFFNRTRRVLKTTANLWVNLGDTYFARWGSIRDEGRQGYAESRQRRRTPSGGYLHDKQLLLIPTRFAIAMQDAGWILRNDLIWVKPQVMPRPESDRLRSSHEHWLHFVQRQPSARPRYYYDLDGCEEGARDVVTYLPVPGSDGHTATFPPELIRPRIRSSCPPGGLVLDPFCGTGRAVIEALRLGRSGLGFEVYEAYAAAAKRRVADALAEESEDTSIATAVASRPSSSA